MAAGMGAGWASTPMDVVKTRIQVGEHGPSCWAAVLGAAGAGGWCPALRRPHGLRFCSQVKNAKFDSIRQALPAILKEEGVPAFFKGSVPRMTIIGPLFAIALFSFEVQKAIMVKLGWTGPAPAK